MKGSIAAMLAAAERFPPERLARTHLHHLYGG